MSISACNNFNRCSLKIPGESSIGAQFYSARFTWYTVDLNHGYEWLYERIPGLCSSVSITRKIEKKREKEREREMERAEDKERNKRYEEGWRGIGGYRKSKKIMSIFCRYRFSVEFRQRCAQNIAWNFDQNEINYELSGWLKKKKKKK